MRVQLANVIDKTTGTKRNCNLEGPLPTSSTKPCTINIFTHSFIILHKPGTVQFSTATFYEPKEFQYCSSPPITTVGGFSRATKREADAILILRASKKLKLGNSSLKVSYDNSPVLCKETGVNWEVVQAKEGLESSTKCTDCWKTLHKLVERVEEVTHMVSSSNNSTLINIPAIVSTGERPPTLSRFEKWCYIAEFMRQYPEDLTYVNKIFLHLLENPQPNNLYESINFSETLPTLTLGRTNNLWGYF
jgi:hypothetical protein